MAVAQSHRSLMCACVRVWVLLFLATTWSCVQEGKDLSSKVPYSSKYCRGIVLYFGSVRSSLP